MNNNILSSKRILLIVTMLSATMLAISSTPPLVPTTAFAQEGIPDVDALLTLTSPDSTSEESTSDVEADSTSEESTSDVEAGDVIVDPVVETEAEADANVNADTHVITDEEDCEEVNDEVNQANTQSINQEGNNGGDVGDNGVFVGPRVQTAAEAGFNVNADFDVILVEGCNPPSDELNQANTQSVNQGTVSDVEAGEDSTIVRPAFQRADVIARNIGHDTDVFAPVL
jgi:hypothetical protein